jgi:hypothetical protein
MHNKGEKLTEKVRESKCKIWTLTFLTEFLMKYDSSFVEICPLIVH